MFQGNDSPAGLLKNKNSRFPSRMASQSGAGPRPRRREPGAKASCAGQVYIHYNLAMLPCKWKPRFVYRLGSPKKLTDLREAC